VPRRLKTLVVLVLLALLPLRAVAAVTIGLCAMDQKQEVASAHHGCEEERPAQTQKSSSCSICVEHCSSAAFVLPAVQSVAGQAMSEAGVPLAERVAPAFFPEHLDRPPLA
jgi:hypothetical protein